jgi:O-antigen/teichoic acid export membrane protein
MFYKVINSQLSSEFLKYFHNSAWMFFDKIFKMALGFFVIAYITRYLGPDRFGLLTYSQSVVNIFLALSTLGLANGGVLVRELVANRKKRNILLGTVFYLTLFTSFLAISIILGMLSFLPDGKSNILIFIISFSIIFQNISIIIIDYFQYKVLSKYVTYCSSAAFIISSILKIALIYFEAELELFACALLFDSAMLLLGLTYMYKRQGLSIKHWKFDTTIARKLLKCALPLTLVAVSALIYTRIDQIMIKNMIGNEAAGNYSAAVTVSELFYFIPGIIVTSMFPKIVALKGDDEYKYLCLLEKMYRLTLWIILPISISMFFFSNSIVSVIYGSQYIQAGPLLSILSWCIIFSSINAVFVKMLYVEGFEKKYLYKTLSGVLINLILNYIFIRRYGVNGAAIATLFTLFAVNYIFDIFDKELRKFYYLKFVCWIPYNKKEPH